MQPIVAILLGAVLAAALVYVARRRPAERENVVYAVGLLVAALIYVGLAAVGGAPARWLALESGALLGFGAVAWAGARQRAALLAAGWAAHVLWDLLLHLGGTPGAAYTPDWYPWLCLSFDLVIAGAILRRDRVTRPTR